VAWSLPVVLHEEVHCQIPALFDRFVGMMWIVVMIVVGLTIAAWVDLDLDLDHLSFEQDTVAAVCLAVVVVAAVVDVVGYTSSLVVDHKTADHTCVVQLLVVLDQDTSFAQIDRPFPLVVVHPHHPWEHSQDLPYTCSVGVVVAFVVHHDDYHGVLIVY